MPSGSRTPGRTGWRFGTPPAEAIFALDHAERLTFARPLTELAERMSCRNLDDPDLLTEVEITAHSLPTELLSQLIRFRAQGNGHGILLIRNLPVDLPLPATPSAGYLASWEELPQGTLAQLAVTSLVGQVIAYADEKRGNLVQDVCPVPGEELRQENSGSALLEVHTEDGFHPFKPEIISLLCLRADHGRTAVTVTASIASVLPQLSAPVLQVLREPIYRIRFSSSFLGRQEGALYSPPLPVLTGPQDDPGLCADFYAMEPLQQRGAEAFEALREAITSALIGVVLEPGELLLVDNRVAVHGRTGFMPRYDGADRWLRRCLAVTSLWPSRGFRHGSSRVCAPVSLAVP